MEVGAGYDVEQPRSQLSPSLALERAAPYLHVGLLDWTEPEDSMTLDN